MKDQFQQYTLWSCLLCGHIGCFNKMTKLARDTAEDHELVNVQRGHAFDHYNETKHVYAMEIESKMVWDFSKENFVNRLIQNQVDGKLVEVQHNLDGQGTDALPKNSAGQKEVQLDSVFQYNKKLEALNHEYNTILIQTLENQRDYFESQIQNVHQQNQEAKENKIAQINERQQELQNIEEEIKKYEQILKAEEDKNQAL